MKKIKRQDGNRTNFETKRQDDCNYSTTRLSNSITPDLLLMF
jgi:hypothetical protein